MSEEVLTDSTEAVSQETMEVVEPVIADEESQTDYWDEDFDSTELPEETNEVEPELDVVEDKQPEYITQGLGDLDEPIVVKVNGKIYDIKDKDQIRDLMERGFNATQKLQELAEVRRELELQKNPDATEQELSNIDTSAEVEQIAEKIASSEYVEDFKSFIDVLPSSVTEQLRSDPRMLDGLRQDIQSGLAAKILPTMQRYMDVEGLDFREAYIKGGNEVMKSAKSRGQTVDKLTSVPKRTGNVEVKQKSTWDMSDSEYKSLMETERR